MEPFPPLDPRERFSDRVADYVRFRPSYPSALLKFMRENAGLNPEDSVADVGSGTGIFTGLLLDWAGRVFAVEPNDAMRAAAETALGSHPHFTSVKGQAEDTGLADASVTLVTCAQAFHWFDVARSRREFRRILRPGGRTALVWNTALRDRTEFARGYERIKENLGAAFEHVRHESIGKEARCDAFFGIGGWARHAFPHSQALDLAGLKGRLLSSSYAPQEGRAGHHEMMADLTALFLRTESGGKITMEYETEVYLGRFGPTPD